MFISAYLCLFMFISTADVAALLVTCGSLLLSELHSSMVLPEAVRKPRLTASLNSATGQEVIVAQQPKQPVAPHAVLKHHRSAVDVSKAYREEDIC